ncbi:MAG: hypothetical protein A6D91_11730 [Bacillaceae bacterium G1]|nr:MAG: hypothetical protein A6D91_11730 [Bacillaceae bacterium G1]
MLKPPKKAVALRYERGKDRAPRVTAKGQGWLAEQILKRAGDNTPVVEDAALVEVLYQLELQQEIPPHLYQAVAEILAFVYRLDKGEAVDDER